MPVAKFPEEEIKWAKKAIKVKAGVPVSQSLSFKKGTPVTILKESSRMYERVCEVVKVAGGAFWVEPYNDAYWNDPAVLTKPGPFTEKDLKKVRKPKGASLKWKPKKQEKGLSWAKIVELEAEEAAAKKPAPKKKKAPAKKKVAKKKGNLTKFSK